MLGDLFQVRLVGETLCRNMLTRKLIHLRGFEQFLLDLYDHPEFVHRMMAFLRDDTLQEWELYEREGVLSRNGGPEFIRGSGGLTCTDLLPSGSGPARMQEMVCFGESQESIGVSPELFEEFVLQYQLPIMNRFGLVDYGCCEPQDGKFDPLFSQIPHLSSVSVHPWGNRELAAEKLADRHIYAYKPHPGTIELPDPDYATAEQELRQTLTIAKGLPGVPDHEDPAHPRNRRPHHPLDRCCPAGGRQDELGRFQLLAGGLGLDLRPVPKLGNVLPRLPIVAPGRPSAGWPGGPRPPAV